MASRPFAAAFALLVLVFASLGLASCSGGGDGDKPKDGDLTLDANGWRGARILFPKKMPDATLTATDGSAFNLREKTAGKVALVYVGYTHCPDICPTHLALLNRALKEIPPDVASEVMVIFVTADPARDTPEVLGKYLAAYNSTFIGLTGEPAQLERLQRDLGMNPATTEDLGGGNYAVNHAAYVMAFDREGASNLVYPGGIKVEDWTHDLVKLVREGWSEG